jgi:hypothetical protein
VSDYDYTEFGNWDQDSGSYHVDYSPPSRPLDLLPASSPLRYPTSPLGLNIPSLLEAALFIEQIGSPQGPTAYIEQVDSPQVAAAYIAPSSPLTPIPERSVSPELRYPSSPRSIKQESPTIRLVTPVPRPQSLPTEFPLSPRPDSPIDYERVAQGEERISTPEAQPYPFVDPLLPHPNQENIPPAPIYRPPSCVNGPHEHPHLFTALQTERAEEWRPLDETNQDSFLTIHTIEDLCNVPPRFPGVLPFRIKAPHFITIFPRNHQVAINLGVAPITACSKAIHVPPCGDLPLGAIKYSFRKGIRDSFAPIPPLIKHAYQGSIIILEIQDFLDGRTVTTYGYLHFQTRFRVEQAYTTHQTFQFDDWIRRAPFLLNYCFSPRIPADPFNFISVYHDDQPL